MSLDSSYITNVQNQVSYISDVDSGNPSYPNSSPIKNLNLTQQEIDIYRSYRQNVQNENYQIANKEEDIVSKISSALDLDNSNEGVQSSLTKFIDYVKTLFKHSDSQRNYADLDTLDTLIESIRALDNNSAKRLMYAALIRTTREATQIFDNVFERDAVRMAIMRKIIPQYESELPTDGGNAVLNAWQRDSLRAGQSRNSISGIINGTTSIASLFGPGGLFKALEGIGMIGKISVGARITGLLSKVPALRALEGLTLPAKVNALLTKFPILKNMFPWLITGDQILDVVSASGDGINSTGEVLQGELNFREDLRSIRDRYNAGGWNVWDYASNLLSGALGGAVIGGATGSVIPGAGTAVGAIVGGVAGFANSFIHMNNTHDLSNNQDAEMSDARSGLFGGIDIQALVGDQSDFMEVFAKNLVDGEHAHYADILGSSASIDDSAVSYVPDIEIPPESTDETERGNNDPITEEEEEPGSNSNEDAHDANAVFARQT